MVGVHVSYTRMSAVVLVVADHAINEQGRTSRSILDRSEASRVADSTPCPSGGAGGAGAGASMWAPAGAGMATGAGVNATPSSGPRWKVRRRRKPANHGVCVIMKFPPGRSRRS